MRKLMRFFRFIAKAWSIFWVRIVVLFGVILGICAIGGAFDSKESFSEKAIELLTSGDVLVTLLIAAITLVVAHIAVVMMSKLEDSYKIEADQKKIIIKYSGHKKRTIDDNCFYDLDGVFMYLTCPPKNCNRRRFCKRPHNWTKRHTEERELRADIIYSYLALTDKEKEEAKEKEKANAALGTRSRNVKPEREKKRECKWVWLRERLREKERAKQIIQSKTYSLYLPGLNLFANIKGDTKVCFEDKNTLVEPPDFVRENALDLMEAHKNSKYSNNSTIRLKNISYDDKSKKLVLETERTQYFDMLITNRCMDFKLKSLVSVRAVYESGSKITPLEKSLLSNQIGINGLIFTADGYLLLEKRGYKKVTWKGKLAQPISLAMKKDDIASEMRDDRLLPHLDEKGNEKETPEVYANGIFKTIISKTIKNNFGITEGDIEKFDISRNLLGVARDLLEGGKPNIYFYVVVKKTADECKQMLEERAKRAAEATISVRKETKDMPNISYDKLDSDYYLIALDDIGIDFGYKLKVKAKNIKKVYRKFRPMVMLLPAKADGFAYRVKRKLGLSLKEECGDALLTCLHYVGVCRERLDNELSEIRKSIC